MKRLLAPLAGLAVLSVATAATAEPVRVAICQMPSVDGDVAGNLAKMDVLLQQAKAAGARIAVFPELVDVGFGPIVKASTGSEHARPIPGETTDALGAMALANDIWIEAALLETVAGGVYDTNVIIDSAGKVVLKQRKAFVFPLFGGAKAFQGNYHDMDAVDSPFGPLGVLNCKDMGYASKRLLLASHNPALSLVSFANPPSDLLEFTDDLAQETQAPVVGVNMLFPGEPDPGGTSRFVDAAGTTLWQAGSGELVQTWDLDVTLPTNRPPEVAAGDVRTIRWPESKVELTGYAVDDALPGGSLVLQWSQVGGPGAVTFEDPVAVSTTATFSQEGLYVLRLTAQDGALEGSSEVIVTVLPAAGDPYLVGHWPFDGTAADASGTGNQGTLVGNPTYSTDAAPTGGAGAQSLVLDGGDYVTVPHDASLSSSGSVTIAMWFKPSVTFAGFVGNGGNDWATLVKKGDTWGGEDYLLSLGAYFYVFARGMDVMVPALDDAILDPGAWVHIAAVLDAHARSAKIFINGVRDQMVLSVPTPTSNSDVLRIGGANLIGKIDDVRIYKRPLSDEEIAELVPGAVVNAPPTVDAGRPLAVANGTPLALTGSFQDDGHPATSAAATWTRWRKLSGPGEVVFDDRFALDTTVTFSADGEYALELVASDGGHRVARPLSVMVGEGAGAGGSGAGGASGAGAGGPGPGDGSGAESGSSGADADGGCGCRFDGRTSAAGTWLLSWALVALAHRRVRRWRPWRPGPRANPATASSAGAPSSSCSRVRSGTTPGC